MTPLIHLFSTAILCSLMINTQVVATPSVGADTIKVWNVTAEKITTDPLSQHYLVSGGTLVKYDTEGDSAYSWSDPPSGRIAMIDASDPMRILVYQKDFNLVRFLNNRLAPISSPIRLDDIGITSTLALATAHQGGFWIVDGSNRRLKLMGQQLETLLESAPLTLSVSPGTSEYKMIETGDRVFLLIPDECILEFDLFANLVRRIPIKAPSFDVAANKILLVYPEKIILWTDPVTDPVELVNLPGAGIREACLSQKHLLIRTSKKVILLKR
jgi:hypothetical protein